ncbi:glycosyltransferase [Arthrobacter monumenti]
MKLTLKGFRHGKESPVAEARAALEMVGSSTIGKPILVGYTPVGRTNPYQALLYKQFAPAGLAASPVIKSWDFLRLLEARENARAVVLHIHWTSFVLNEIKSYVTAKKKVSDFRHELDAFIKGGGKVVWTLHNVIPHDSLYPALEMQIQQYLADRADVIHILSQASADIMREHISFENSKLLLSPHANYRGTYEDFIPKEEARLSLGIRPDERVYVLLGALKAYKGLKNLYESFEEFCRGSSQPRRLLVGGMPDESVEVAEFVKLCERSPNVLIEAKKIPANFVQYYMRAADIGLAPYARMLNSGAILLYQTFDLPVITSDVKAVWENLTHDIAEKVDSPGDREKLVDSFRRAERFFDDDVSWRIRSFTNNYEADALSRAFASDLRSRLMS